MPSPVIQIEISPGELIDRLTILVLKKDRIRDRAKRANVTAELQDLELLRKRRIGFPDGILPLECELYAVNAALWDVEDALRRCEKARDFGPRFVELARSVYHHNDRRAALKREINEALGSTLVEEKSYAA